MQRDEELEWIFCVRLSDASLDLLLDLVLPLLAMGCEVEELVLVCPQNGLVLLDRKSVV